MPNLNEKKPPVQRKKPKQEAAKLGDDPVLRERLESIRGIIAEADDLASVDPGSITGMFMQEMCSKHDKKKRKVKK
jgi:hypothetical protein